MTNPADDLQEIKAMMAKSTRFLSLSGSSGVLIGIYASIAAWLAYTWLYPEGFIEELNNWLNPEDLFPRFLILATGLIVLTLGTAYFLSRLRSKKNAEQIWSPAGRRFLSALFLPLVVGGLTIVAQLYAENYTFIPGTMLIFYGLALLNAAKFTVGTIRNLGMIQVLLGLFSHFFPELGLLFWWLGFGLTHIFYGAIMYFKYEK
ncbi:hypothetical protein [Algoriphagus sediminis]|uniref:Uncharacterized protein n=1 Tax=Algoriphagus sediminis TaxID=3057113 RepID=A0ABT7Y9K1_9BACT|nr:hypothetical protein [Algoriphagus sediminis]MDN3203198.1 hypothetical protein [Algoriphagus sediminis]